MGAFLAIFPIFLGFVRIFWETLAMYFADFGAILAIFDHFWAIFGPFLDHFFFALFCRKMAFWPRNKRRILESRNSIAPGGGRSGIAQPLYLSLPHPSHVVVRRPPPMLSSDDNPPICCRPTTTLPLWASYKTKSTT